MPILQKISSHRIARTLSTVSARTLLLILTATLPLAVLAGGLSWHSYSQNSLKSFENTKSDAQEALKAITSNITEINNTARFFAESDLPPQRSENYFQLLETISNNQYCDATFFSQKNAVIFSISSSNKYICDKKNAPNSSQIIQSGDNIYISTLRKIKITDGYFLLRKDITSYINQSIEKNTHFYIVSNNTSSLMNVPIKIIPQKILSTLQKDIAHHRNDDALTYGTINLSFNSISPGFFLLTVHQWTDDENKSQHRLLINFSIITTAIAIELMLMFVSAREFLVEPLEQLTFSVRGWRRGERFSPHTHKAIPLEVRQLERAFLRATRHLSLRENELQKATQQQDHLIHEIHHRVKNNLQIIVSLLNLHANRVTSPEAKKEFQLVRERVKAISTLHHHLYKNSEINCLYAQKFIPEISENVLFSEKGRHNNNINLKLDIDDITISSSQSVPITLIITETISNSVRYAFPNNQSGDIFVSLKHDNHAHNAVILTLSDNGIGIPSDAQDSPQQNGIGQKLIRGFARQLHAELSIEYEGGTTYRVSFALEPLDPTPSTLAKNAIHAQTPSKRHD